MRASILVLLAACGRVGFESTSFDAADPDAAPPPCPALPGVMFCESFEGAPALPTTAGTVALEGALAFRGDRSQHAQTAGTSEASWQLGGVLPYVTSGELHARWHMYIPGSVTDVQLAAVHLVDDVSPFHGLIFGLREGMAEVTSSEAGTTTALTLPIPRDRWICAQMYVRIADTGGEIGGAIDEQPISAITNIDTLPPSGFRNVHIGLFATSLATGPMEMWTDEVAIGTQPIPCE